MKQHLQPRTPTSQMCFTTNLLQQLMIANHHYFCGGSSPSEAVMVCTEKGCTGFALCCPRGDCDCRTTHDSHHMIVLTDMIRRTLEPVKLPEHHLKQAKDINIMIDSLIHDLEKMKTAHGKHLQTALEREVGSLYRKLAQKQELERGEATGDGFYKLMQTVGKSNQIPSPYGLSNQQIEQRMKLITAEMGVICKKVEALWIAKGSEIVLSTSNESINSEKSEGANTLLMPPAAKQQQNKTTFRFSHILKQLRIQLSNFNTKATGVNLVLAEPALQTGTTSTISFRISKLGNGVSFGVGYRQKAEKLYFLLKLSSIGQGVYLLRDDGYVFSNSVPTDNCKQLSQLTFTEGSVITLELDPSNGKLTYSKSGGPSFVQDTAINNTVTEPVHFCAFMSIGSEVDIVD